MTLTYNEMAKKWSNGDRDEVIDIIRNMRSIDAALTALGLVSRMDNKDAESLKSALFHA
jgi:hypothetical protein